MYVHNQLWQLHNGKSLRVAVSPRGYSFDQDWPTQGTKTGKQSQLPSHSWPWPPMSAGTKLELRNFWTWQHQVFTDPVTTTCWGWAVTASTHFPLSPSLSRTSSSWPALCICLASLALRVFEFASSLLKSKQQRSAFATTFSWSPFWPFFWSFSCLWSWSPQACLCHY